VRYLCLVYDNHSSRTSPSLGEVDEQSRAREDADALRRSGHYVDSAELTQGETSAVVRVRHERMSVTDGPFTAEADQLRSIYLIEARDLNEAIQVVAKLPSARTGTIELRSASRR
jgi:hypothetical protein